MVFGVLYRLKALASFVHPTYGNTMYHTGMIRIIAETGMMPIYDLSYGGFTKSFYVPAYRLFIASLSVFSNLDPMLIAGLSVVAFGAVTIAAVYLLGKEFGGVGVGLASAFLFVLSPELTIYTIRPFPEVIGITFLLLTLYFLKKNNLLFMVLASVLTALSHQTSAVVLGAILVVHATIKRDKHSFIALVAAVLAYFSWQFFSLNSLDILAMRQIALKESGAVTAMHLERIGAFALLASVFAIPIILKNWKKKLLLIAFIVATVILTKNELLGIGIFTDRFFTFFALAMVFVGGIGIKEIVKRLEAAKWK